MPDPTPAPMTKAEAEAMNDRPCIMCGGVGSIALQHPIKPPGVIAHMTPCPLCEALRSVVALHDEVDRLRRERDEARGVALTVWRLLGLARGGLCGDVDPLERAEILNATGYDAPEWVIRAHLDATTDKGGSDATD